MVHVMVWCRQQAISIFVVKWGYQGTQGNQFADKHNAPLLLFTWKMFISTALTNISIFMF